MSDLGNQLPEAPSDGITTLRFAPESNLLLSASWDCTARIYDAARCIHQTTLTQESPILDASWLGNDHSSIATASLDHHVCRIDISTGQSITIGRHDAPVRCIEYLPSINLVVSAGWDGYLHLWDPRSSYSSPSNAQSVQAIKLPGKAYSMSASKNRLVIATSGRYIEVYDIPSLFRYHLATLQHTSVTATIDPEQHRESPLKYQTRCVRCFSDDTGFAVSSIEGRVAMEYFTEENDAKSKQYAFKCHRKTIDGMDTIYPVNAIAFNSLYGTFATGGCDGVVNIWDGANKKRLQQIRGYPTSVAALAFNHDASLLAVASSYTFEKGDLSSTEEAVADSIYVRAMSDAELRPRQRQQ